MKKTLSWIMVAAFATASLAACDKKPAGTPSDGAVPTPSTTSPAPSPAPSPMPAPSSDSSASSPASAASS
ncbi:MAG TPA: hypothetical protein VJO99_01935 [Burkholderiaceae bacterium]|nr:hypothetical protein [Burkholderiaceae bacterium]